MQDVGHLAQPSQDPVHRSVSAVDHRLVFLVWVGRLLEVSDQLGCFHRACQPHLLRTGPLQQELPEEAQIDGSESLPFVSVHLDPAFRLHHILALASQGDGQNE